MKINSIIKLYRLLLEIVDLGFVGSVYRIYYELKFRFGVLSYKDNKLMKLYRNFEFNFNIENIKEFHGKFFYSTDLIKLINFINNLDEVDKKNICRIADEAINGKILCFSKKSYNYGNPIKWHFNPAIQKNWSSSEHWTKSLRTANKGDIKFLWEIGRFPQIFYFVRAYYIANDLKYANAFMSHIMHWINNNPFPSGVHWASGQEIAIRLLSWIFGYFTFYQHTNNAFINKFLSSVYIQCEHIYNHIDYSYYSVQNNHLIGEATALFVVGIIFPFLDHSQKWKIKGYNILNNKVLNQFYPDGGYCQQSHTYHRLALQYLIWSIRIGELNNIKFRDEIYIILENSMNFLYQNMNLIDGKLPNWGNNDGANLTPWTSCDYTDFRPLLSVLFYLTKKKKIFPNGPWDEELVWYYNSLPDNLETIPQKNNSYINTGIHILRKSLNEFLVFRCGTMPDRYGQADQLHVDLWMNGINMACDAGTYLYNDELRYSNYFMGTKSHNTVVIDNLDQMLLYRRFKWLNKSKAKITKITDKEIEGRHFSIKNIDKKLIQTRNIKWLEDFIVITDTIENRANLSHHYNIHWNINANVKLIENDEMGVFEIILSNKNKYYLYVFDYNAAINSPQKIRLESGADDGNGVDGWYSRYYGYKEPVHSIHYNINSNRSYLTFLSIFSSKYLPKEELLQCIFY